MIDREKVIKGLETCSDVYCGADNACSSCPYSQTNGDECLTKLVHDAIALLKEQEEIVRCKECRYNHGINEGCGARNFYPPSGDWFCADGKR